MPCTRCREGRCSYCEKPVKQRRVNVSIVFKVLLILAFLPSLALAQTFPNPQVEKLLGPQSLLGAPTSITSIAAFDKLQLAGGEQFRIGGVRDPLVGGGYIGDANYYDLAFTLYQLYYRTGDVKWRNYGREMATKWRDSPSGDLTMWRRKLNGEYGFPGEEAMPAPRGASTLGLAMLAADGTDAKARELVYNHVRMYRCWGSGGKFLDQRESAYVLMAALASVVIGDADSVWEYGACADPTFPKRSMTPRQVAKELLDMQLATQGALGPPGSLLTLQDTAPSSGANPPNTPWSNLFMTGLLAEAWVMYDRIIGDPRIVPAIEAWMQWMWATQWYAQEQAFAYSNATIKWPSGDAVRYPEPGLNGIYLNGWGYVAGKTKKAEYVSQMNQIISGMLRAYPNPQDSYNFFLTKMYPENFRNAGRGLGALTNGGTIPPQQLKVTLAAETLVTGGAGKTTPLTATPDGKPVKSVDFVLTAGPGLTNVVILIPSVTQAPYVFPWDLDPRWTPVGEYKIQAVATATDDSKAESNTITIQVMPDVPPVLPSKGETEISVVYLRVTPTSGRAVMKVQFFVNGVAYSTADSKGPVYSRRWGRPDGPTGPLPGPYVFTATIFYKDGGQETVPVEPEVKK